LGDPRLAVRPRPRHVAGLPRLDDRSILSVVLPGSRFATTRLLILTGAALIASLLLAVDAAAQVTSCGGQPIGTPCWEAGGGCWTVGSCLFGTCTGSVPHAPGTSCNDGLFCNGSDTCDGAGTCVSPGDPCSGPDGDADCSESCNETTDSCTAYDPDSTVCDSGTECTNAGTCVEGICLFLNVSNGTPCTQDGAFCNGAEVCQDGTCSSPGDPCAGPDGDFDCSETCNEATNSCTASDPNGSACNDGLDCTTGTTCSAGVCGDGFDLPDGTLCSSDGAFCNGAEVCQSGACLSPGDPCVGPDGDGDCSESCDESADSCSAPDPDSSICDDGNECTRFDACRSGVCDGPPEAAGTPCTSDGFFCNGAEICLSGACVPPGNPCAGPDGDGDCSESCDEASDACSAPDPDGSACEDGNTCTTDTCVAGACANHADDLGAACDDGLFCNGIDTCGAGGTCLGSGDPCSGPDGDADCSESCDEASDSCTLADPDGSVCDDGDACTSVSACGAGTCNVITAIDCDDGDPCTAESCDAITGCGHTPIPGCVSDSGCVNSTDGEIDVLIDTLRVAGESITIDGADSDWSPFPTFTDPAEDVPGNPGQEILAGAIAPLADRIKIYARLAGAPPTTTGVLNDGAFAVSLEMLGSPAIDAQIVLNPQTGIHPLILFDVRNNPILPPSRFISDPALQIAAGPDFIEVDVPYSVLTPFGKPLEDLPGARKWARGAVASLDATGAVLDIGPATGSYRLLTTPFTLDEPLFTVSPPNPPPLSMTLPVDGQWFIQQGSDGSVTHQGYFAFDMSLVDGSLSFSSPPGSTDNADYFSFGEPIYAPLPGTISESVDLNPDEIPPIPPSGSSPANLVRLDTGGGLSVAMLHLQQGSALVSSGASVFEADLLASVGNSGYSDLPHLHVEVNEPGGPLGASIRSAELTNVRVSLNPVPDDPWARECTSWQPREGFLVEALPPPPQVPTLGLAGRGALVLLAVGAGWLWRRWPSDSR
jgi:Peptidase family M23/Dictyostelium (slime mold) repeat